MNTTVNLRVNYTIDDINLSKFYKDNQSLFPNVKMQNTTD